MLEVDFAVGIVECQSKSVQPVWKLPPVYSHVMQRYQKPSDLKWIFRHENVFYLNRSVPAMF